MKKNVPNILSVFRIICAIALLCTMLFISPETDKLKFILIPGIIFGIGCLTDMLDGKIARHYNIVSDFGKFVDPIGDKILTFFAMLGFMFIGADKKFPFMLVCVAVTLLREFTVSSVRMIFATKGTVVAANIYGKLKTVFQMSALIMYFFMIETKYIFIAQIFVSIATVLTVISGIIYLKDFIKSIKKG